MIWYVGRAAVRVVLLDMMRKPTSRDYHESSRSLHIVTGMGNNSKDREAVIKVRIYTVYQENTLFIAIIALLPSGRISRLCFFYSRLNGETVKRRATRV